MPEPIVSPQATVFVVDDEPNARESVEALARSHGYPCRTFGSAESFLAGYPLNAPGCLVTDIRMLGMNGLELVQSLPAHGITLPVIAISGYADTNLAVAVMRAGAVTMLEKPCPQDQLIEAIRGALERDARQRLAEQERSRFETKFKLLTEPERAVLNGVLEGKPNKSIARELDVRIRTVESRRQRVFSKMECKTVAELVRWSTRAGYDPGS